MNIDYENRMHKSVIDFKKIASEAHPQWSETNDNGEWEIDLDEFDEMCSIAFEIIKTISPEEASAQLVDDLLFAIARDNEYSRIVYELLEYPAWFSILCRKSLETDYRNAKWQFAENLKDYNGHDDLQDLIFEFLAVDDEYTERLALQSLAYIYPDKAEKYAIEFWHRDKYTDDYGSEYQKIMVLHVLNIIHSPELEKYLDLADHTDYRYLRENAAEIRKTLVDQEA